MKTKLITISLASAFLSSVLFAQAATVIEYEPGNTETHSRPADTTSSTEVIYNFSDTTPLIDADPLRNARVYGGFNITAADDAGALLRENNSGFLNVAASGDPDRSLRGVFIWNKEDFRSGGDALPVAFDANSSMTVNIRQFATDPVQMKFVVKQDDAYYVSLTNIDSAGVHTLSDPAGEQWAPMNDLTGYTWPNEFEARTFDNIEGVGVFARATRSAASGSALFNLQGFEVEATVIPEPAHAATLISLVGLAGLIYYRLRRRIS